MITLEQMRIFVFVAEREHLTQAAAVLNLTPSAVSSAIKTVEERFQVQLFHRVGRHIRLSDAGSIFVEECRQTLARAKMAETTLREFGTLQRGSLSIHASQTIASYWLPPYLARFRTTYPLIALNLTIGNTKQVEEAVESGMTDIGLAEGDMLDGGLDVRIIGHDRLVIVVGKHHALAKKAKVTFSDLVAFPWIMREKGSGTRSVFEQTLTERGHDCAAFPVVLTLPSNEAVLSAVQSCNAITAVSNLAAGTQIAAGTMVMLHFEPVSRDLILARHPARYQTKAVQAFVNLLEAETKA